MKRARKAFTLWLLGLMAAPAVLAGSTALDLDAEAKRYQSDIEILASDSMEGRGLETEGIHKATTWIEKRLKALDLAPAFGTSYRQPFDVKMGVSKKEGNRIDGLSDDAWTPLGFSSSGEFDGPLVFAGYGINAEPIGYNEWAGLDLHGKVVLLLRYEPQERDESSPFSGRKPSRWSALRYKVLQARERGAAAVVFVTGPLQDEGSDKIPALANDGPESPAGLPVFQVKTSVARQWLASAGIDLEEFQKSVDRDLTPRSKPIPQMTIRGRIALEATYARAENVAGLIPGKGPLADEIVVIGAHYDHLGWGGRASMRPNDHAIHNGADDNASGTIAVLHAAARLKKLLEDSSNHRTVAMVLFSGEEVGLAGSSWFVDHAPFDMKRVVAMVNLDMVGRLQDNHVTAMGSESAPQWNPALAGIAKKTDLEIGTGGDGYGPSDQTSFYARQIPVLHFFTGAHEQYHSPEDDANLINAAGAAKVVELTALVGEELALGRLNPTYVRADAAPAMEGDSRGYGAYLGTIPDYSAMEATEGGVLLGDVRPGGPADLAGIKGGDRIIEMAGTRIANLYDMTFSLQDHKPGETIDVVVIRDGNPITLRATLGDRANRAGAPKPKNEEPTKDENAKAKPAAAPAPAPPSPHAGPMPSAVGKKGLDPFYENRPGKDFVIKAGKPYDRPVEGERHFKDIRQLTFGGENAEAYFSPDGTKLIYQVTLTRDSCDQQYILDLATGENTMVSSGKGRTTCGYFDYPEQDRVIYASTEHGGEDCPPPPDRSQGYVWAVYDTYDLYEANLDGTHARRLTTAPGYDAEATWCHRGGKIVFTSVRDGDLDLYEMDESGSVRRLTDTPGYDGGAFFSPDCSQIVWRASRPTGKDLEEYQGLLKQGLVRPTNLEIFVMNADGTDQRQLTNTDAGNFCPYFYPTGDRIIYSSNAGGDPREFDLHAVDTDGGNPERITFAEGFDGFPMFSPDGQFIVWASNRADPESHQTNLFIARWVK